MFIRNRGYRHVLLPCIVLMTGGGSVDRVDAKEAKDVGVEVRFEQQGKPVEFGGRAGGQGVEITRLDFLMSGLALKRTDGTWLESSGWYACFRGSEGRCHALLEGVPAQAYTGVRFVVGVDEAGEKADVNRWPATHALNPVVNGLHWGWQGGFIYAALEGHYTKSDGAVGGFSYHLAGEKQRMTVELEGALDLTRGGTVELVFDVEKVLGGVRPAEFGEATHSREGDAKAGVLRGRMEKAFSLAGVAAEVWQEPAVAGVGEPARPKGTSYLMHISSRMPKVSLPADNVPTREGVELGRRLFTDTRLSRTGMQSCASCHQQGAGFADAGKKFSLGVDGLPGKRNAMALSNLAWQPEFFWDGRVKRLRDQVLVPVQDPLEMHETLERVVEKLSADQTEAARFERVFGPGGVTGARVGLALEQFLLTLVSQDSRFDQALLGRVKLTPVEQRGLELFITEHDPARNLRGADCFHCHGGALFSSQGFANNGLDASPEAGRQAVTGQEADRGKFRVPSLRNVAVTGPYMHDGRFSTLEDVIDHYDHGVQRTATLDPNLSKHPVAGLGLTAADKAALAAFLRTLTDDAFLKPAAAAASTLSLSKP